MAVVQHCLTLTLERPNIIWPISSDLYIELGQHPAAMSWVDHWPRRCPCIDASPRTCIDDRVCACVRACACLNEKTWLVHVGLHHLRVWTTVIVKQSDLNARLNITKDPVQSKKQLQPRSLWTVKCLCYETQSVRAHCFAPARNHRTVT